MSKLKPSSFDVYPIYECDCGCDFNEEIIFTQKIGKILCGCGKVLVIEPIESIDCIPRYKQSQPIQQQVAPTPIRKKININNKAIQQAVEALTMLGWKSKKADNLVKQLSDSYSGDWDNFSEHVIRQVHAKQI